ncbi:hypothetical protein FS749_000545 [Ceratobasidium sp. UAMH 11750]|nr:hypothetical protein FS749_000545 [Ceratobasidium sp. UAMH 11750]
MSYWHLTAISQQYRSLPDKTFLYNDSRNLLIFLTPSRPPYAFDARRQDNLDAHWAFAATSAELNAAGIGYHVESGSETSSTSHSTSTRPRALTRSAHDNPHASKRRANLPPWHYDVYGTPPGAASEPVGLSSSRTGSEPRFGDEDGGPIHLPPTHFLSAPVNSPSTPDQASFHQSLPPLQRLDDRARNVLPPIHSIGRSSARASPRFANVHHSAPPTPVFAAAAYAPPGLTSPALQSPAIVDSPRLPHSPLSYVSAPPASRRPANSPSLFGASTVNPPFIDYGAPADPTLCFTRPVHFDSRVPAAAHIPGYFEAPLPHDVRPYVVANLGPNAARAATAFDPHPSGPPPATFDRSVPANKHPHVPAPAQAVTPSVAQPRTPSRATPASQVASTVRSRTSGGPLHMPAQAAHSSVPFAPNRPAKLPNSGSLASGACTSGHPQQSLARREPIKIPRTPDRGLSSDVIDLTFSSSPPDAATLFGPPEVQHNPEPLIKQESITDLFFLEETDELEHDEPEVEDLAPAAPAPVVAVAAVGLPTAHGQGTRRFPWSLYPGGPEKYISSEARLVLFSTDRGRYRWLICKDGYIFECFFPPEFSDAAKLELCNALKAPRKSGNNFIFTKSIRELSETVFMGKRNPSAIHGRLRVLCQNWQNVTLVKDLLGGNVDFNRPQVELINHLNSQISVYRSQHPSLKTFHAWTFITYLDAPPGVESWHARMGHFLRDHPVYAATPFRSGRMSPSASAASAFWTGNSDPDPPANNAPGIPAGPVTNQGTPTVPATNHSASGVAAIGTSAGASGKSKGRPKRGTLENSAVKGSVSSLPSAPSSVSEPASLASTPATGPLDLFGSGHVVPRQPVPPRSGNCTTIGTHSAAASRSTHSPHDVSQASRIELIREAHAVGAQGANDSTWLIHRERDMLKDIRSKEHELKAQRLKIEEAQAQADIDLKHKKQLMEFCLQIQDSPHASAASRSKANLILNATLEASAAAVAFNVPVPNDNGVVAFSTPDPAIRSPAGQPMSPSSGSYQPRSTPVKRQPSQTPGAGPSRSQEGLRLSSRGGSGTVASIPESDRSAGKKAEVDVGNLAGGWGAL